MIGKPIVWKKIQRNESFIGRQLKPNSCDKLWRSNSNSNTLHVFMPLGCFYLCGCLVRRAVTFVSFHKTSKRGTFLQKHSLREVLFNVSWVCHTGILTRIRACQHLQIVRKHEQANIHLISARNWCNGQILRAILNWMGSFDTPKSCTIELNPTPIVWLKLDWVGCGNLDWSILWHSKPVSSNFKEGVEVIWVCMGFNFKPPLTLT